MPPASSTARIYLVDVSGLDRAGLIRAEFDAGGASAGLDGLGKRPWRMRAYLAKLTAWT